MALEAELKLGLDESARQRVSSLSVIRQHATGRAIRRRLTSVYFDTPECDLPRHGVVLRVRRQSGRWIQTVKTAGRVRGGLHQRGEFENVVRQAAPDYERLSAEHGLRLFEDAALQDRIGPAFTTEFWRTSWELNLPGGSVVELSMDAGEIRRGDSIFPICELELELKRGTPEVLYDLALEIATSLDVHIENVSKAERGYALIAGTKPKPVKRLAVTISGAMTVEDAYAAILAGCLDQVQANVAPILDRSDAEGVHQMRVGLRRFRTCLTLFRHWVPGHAFREVKADIRRINRVLGPARDWDVFLQEHLRPMVAGQWIDAHWQDLLAGAERRRNDCYTALVDELGSADYHHAMLRIAAWISCRRWRLALTPDGLDSFNASVKPMAGRMLRRGHQRILKKYVRAGDDVDALHALRIDIKRQRYAVEFFRDLYRGKWVARYRNAAGELQDKTGHLNDAAVAQRFLTALNEDGEDPIVSGFVRGWYARDRLRQLELLPGYFRKFRKQKNFWA